MNTKFAEDLQDVVGCTAGCTWPSARAARAFAGTKDRGGNDDGDTPVTTSVTGTVVVIVADGTAAEAAGIGKPMIPISTVPPTMEENVGSSCAGEFGSMAGSASTEAP